MYIYIDGSVYKSRCRQVHAGLAFDVTLNMANHRAYLVPTINMINICPFTASPPVTLPTYRRATSSPLPHTLTFKERERKLVPTIIMINTCLFTAPPLLTPLTDTLSQLFVSATLYTVKNDPFIKSQLASRHLLKVPDS